MLLPKITRNQLKSSEKSNEQTSAVNNRSGHWLTRTNNFRKRCSKTGRRSIILKPYLHAKIPGRTPRRFDRIVTHSDRRNNSYLRLIKIYNHGRLDGYFQLIE